MLYEQLILDAWNPAVYMTAYIPEIGSEPLMRSASENTPVLRPAVLICPGGGYLGFNESEMEPAALQFLAAGYCVFVLQYSIGAGLSTLPGPIAELSKAIGRIRSQSQGWSIDANRIYVCGFSTGAHLTLLQAACCDMEWLGQMTHLSPDQVRPNGLILGYPIVDLEVFENHLEKNMPDHLPLIGMINRALYAHDTPPEDLTARWHYTAHLNENMPPVFLWAFQQDKFLSDDTLNSIGAQLNLYGIKYESHCFEGGPHGSGLNFKNVLMERARFMETVLNWML